MTKLTTATAEPSRIIWEELETWVRQKVQELIQAILEEEVTELLGRQKSERRPVVDSPPAYRNGYGKERKLTLSCGTITVHRPRVRGLEARFESRVLPFFARRTREKEQWQGERKAWQEGSLVGLEVVYLWVDGIYVKAGLQKEKAALLVVIAGLGIPFDHR
jgi:putative transposase